MLHEGTRDMQQNSIISNGNIDTYHIFTNFELFVFTFTIGSTKSRADENIKLIQKILLKMKWNDKVSDKMRS